ncbi:MAG: DsbA family protein [Pseudomonadota bacterium]
MPIRTPSLMPTRLQSVSGNVRSARFSGTRFGVACVASLGLLVGALGLSAHSSRAQSEAFSPEQKTEIEKIVRSYLLANPEIFLEVQGVLEQRLQEQQTARLKSAITDNAQTLFKRADAPIAGNPDGDVTVVEFFDYNCGFCKRGFRDIASLISEDKNVKVVLKEFPIFGKGSEDAARVALAAKAQGKYWDVHRALLNLESRVDGTSALAAAEKLGLDMTKLKADMSSEPVNEEIATVRELAQKMGINGTPHFLVGDRTIAGAPEDLLEQFKTNVADIRKNGGCKVC